MHIRQFIVLAAIFSCGSLSAAMYKWVDADGNIHYTQNMPPHGAKVLQNPALQRPASSAPAEPGKKASPKPASQQQETAATTPASTELTPEQEEQYREACERLKKNLALLMEPKRVFITTKEGNRHYLSDQEKEERIMRINDQIPRFCRK